MRRRKKVYCDGCANLFFVGGKTTPLCVATAKFEPGPMRKKIEVVGVVSAEGRNCNNDCPYRVSVSMKAWELKRWLLWRLNDGIKKGNRAVERSLKEYPVSVEAKNRVKYQKWKSEDDEIETEARAIELAASRAESFSEDVFVDGGAGGDVQSSADDTDGGEEL